MRRLLNIRSLRLQDSPVGYVCSDLDSKGTKRSKVIKDGEMRLRVSREINASEESCSVRSNIDVDVNEKSESIVEDEVKDQNGLDLALVSFVTVIRESTTDGGVNSTSSE